MTLDTIIEKKLPLIIETFTREVRAREFVPPNESNVEVVNQIEAFLYAIVYALRRGHLKDPEALKLSGYHGEQRARLRYDLGAVLAEFGIVRSAIVEIASEDESITVRELERLGQVLHASMIEAATHFWRQSSRLTIQNAVRAMHQSTSR